jgi:Zn-dependent peptidase ImmA (M78 family)
MILDSRKTQLSKVAEFIAKDFADGNVTSLAEIASFENIGHYFDNYEDAFDGMLLYDNFDFHIHINVDSGNTADSKRGRFTFAHELGHYFIDEHRIGLKYGLLEPHASFHNFNQRNPLEEEADHFASCLLMPEEKFKSHSAQYKRKTGIRTFSFDVLHHLSDSFQTSLLATLIRFGEVGTHEIFAVVSENNIAKWFVKSKDFPNWKFRFKRGERVPDSTVAGEFFTKEDHKVKTIESVDVDDWFVPPKDDERADRQMYEQCFYSDRYGYVISLIWFD